MFFNNQDETYNIVDLYLNNNNIFFGYKDINVDRIILFKKSYNEYIIRYYDVDKMKIVPLQLKIKIFMVSYIYIQNIVE